jgi:hypothetical protein
MYSRTRAAEKEAEEAQLGAQLRGEKRRETINRRKREFLSGARPLPFGARQRRVANDDADAAKRGDRAAVLARLQSDAEKRRDSPGSRRGAAATAFAAEQFARRTRRDRLKMSLSARALQEQRFGVVDAEAQAAPPPRAAPLPRDADLSAFRVRAAFPYRKVQPDELSFAQGEVITVLEGMEEGWVFGAIGERRGVFPFNRVVPIV